MRDLASVAVSVAVHAVASVASAVAHAVASVSVSVAASVVLSVAASVVTLVLVPVGAAVVAAITVSGCSSATRVVRAIDSGVAPDISIRKDIDGYGKDGNCGDASSAQKLSEPCGGEWRNGVGKTGNTGNVMNDTWNGGEPIIMNAIRDSETGEMVATDVINASKVTARFNNVAERLGYITISFDVSVPAPLLSSSLQLRFKPCLYILEDSLSIDELKITGEKYRGRQLRGYERYRDFIASILTDTSDWVMMRQLELFISRNYPETYSMRRDSSIVPEPDALSHFGVSQREALLHYSNTLRHRMNDRKLRNRDKMFRKYVKDPLGMEGVRLDTVICGATGDFSYTYYYTFKSRPGLRKAVLKVPGSVYEDGAKLRDLPLPAELTYYISSLSTLADRTPRYVMKISERVVRDNTVALIDFKTGKYDIDTALGCNSSELARIGRCIGDVFSEQSLVLDSLLISASCSPEGSYKSNAVLALNRSRAVRDYISENLDVDRQLHDSMMVVSAIPENWAKFEKMVIHDTLLTSDTKDKILFEISSEKDHDVRERNISRLPEYKYLREKIYPSLRSVSFDFHLHRRGMVKDTVCTTDLDTVYMAGVEALISLDYPSAVERLRPYRDYNSALAYLAASYNYSALDVLNGLDKDASVSYLLAVVNARLGNMDIALKYLTEAIAEDRSLRYRANLDPELSDLVNKVPPLEYQGYED